MGVFNPTSTSPISFGAVFAKPVGTTSKKMLTNPINNLEQKICINSFSDATMVSLLI